MNIYCVIFMCTFGANNTDTEMPLNNSLISGSNVSGIENGNVTTPVDVASLILPERGGKPVPQMGDIVMELPKIHHDDIPTDAAAASTFLDNDSEAVTTSPESQEMRVTLSEILLPPSAHERHHVYSN